MDPVNYSLTRKACFFSYLSMAAVFVWPSMLFVTFHNTYGISYTLLGTLVLVNFCTQLTVDLIFTFFSKHFNIRKTVIIMPVITTVGILVYSIVPSVSPQNAYVGLVLGTVIFSVSAGLGEVLLSPIIAAIPSEHPEKDMSLLHSLYGWGVVGSVVIASIFFAVFSTERWMYLMGAWAFLPIITSVLFYLSPMPDVNVSSSEGGKTGKGKFIALCALCIFLGSSAENTMTNWISGYMEKALGVSKTLGDMLGLAVFALLLALCRIWYAKYSPDISKTLLVSMIGAAVCYLVAGLSSVTVVAFIAAVLIGLFTSMLWPGTLILMEERLPMPGVTAYALMAACGDLGASVAPQLMGIIVDKVSVSGFAKRLCESGFFTPEEVGLKTGVVIATVFPVLGIVLLAYIMRCYSKNGR